MAQRVTAEENVAPEATQGPPPTDEEAMANLREAFPEAQLQETVHRNA